MPNARKLSPSIISTAALAISSAINFLGVMLWVRILSPQQFGIFALLSSSALFINALAFEWIRTMVARLLYDSSSRFLVNKQKSFLMLLLVTAIASVLLTLSLVAYLTDMTVAGMKATLLPTVILYAISEMAITMINSTSRVRMLHWQFFASMVLRSVLVIMVGYFFTVHLGLGAEGLALGTALAQFAAVIVICMVDPVWRKFSPRALLTSYRGADFKEIFGFGGPLIVSNGLTYLVSIIDRYLIAAVLGSMWVGFYVAPLDLTAKTIGILMLALNIVFYPSVVRAYEDQGRDVARRKMEENLAVQLLLLSLPIVLLTSFPGQVCRIVLGHNFSTESAYLLPWLTLSVAFRVLIANFIMIIFQLEKKTTGVALAPAISLVTVVPLGLLGMWLDGIRGMAIAAAAAQAFTWCVCLLMAKRAMPVQVIRPDIVKILAIDVALLLLALVLPRPDDALYLIVDAAIIGIAFVVLALLARVQALAPISAMIRRR